MPQGELEHAFLKRATRIGSPMGLLMLDIDHFKSVNDRHGHPAGDAALKAVGALLAGGTRAGDLACRLGGEEFAMLLTGMEHADALAAAQAWRSALAALDIPNDAGVLRLTASFGVATFPRQAASLDALMKLADTRLYLAKALGRDHVCSADDLSQSRG